MDSSMDEETEASLLVEIATIARDYATKFLKGPDVADLVEDIMTECLVRMRSGRWRVRVSLEKLVRSKTWTGARDATRKRMRRTVREVEFMRCIEESTHVWMSPELMLEHEELERLHERTLASLPYNCRRAYVMVREERERYQAVADRLGISRLAVCSHVVTAQHRFRERLREEGIMAPPPGPGPGKRDELAHQRATNHVARNGDAGRKNADSYQNAATSDDMRRSGDGEEPSCAPPKRKRRRRGHRRAPASGGMDMLSPLPEPGASRSVSTMSPSGTDAPPATISDPLADTVAPSPRTEATPIGTTGTTTRLDAPSCP